MIKGDVTSVVEHFRYSFMMQKRTKKTILAICIAVKWSSNSDPMQEEGRDGAASMC